MKARIGLTSRDDYTGRIKINILNHNYIDAVLEGGGLPFIIPNLQDLSDIEAYLDMIDGLVFTGGEDISPLLYGQDPIKEVKSISYKRDKTELALFKAAYRRGIPILGICRGMQVVNVALDGSLYQDIHVQIPQALGHISTYRIEGGYHRITIKENSLMFDIFGENSIDVNSQHHQSIKKLGDNLRVSGQTADGVIEAIESTNDNFVLGVQFHPEAMIKENGKFIDIFEYFISKC